jgi:hypothetical protein
MLLVGAALALILGAFVLLARRVRRRGLGGGLMNAAEEIYRPSAKRSREEIQAEVREAAPRPGDPLGRVPGPGPPR